MQFEESNVIVQSLAIVVVMDVGGCNPDNNTSLAWNGLVGCRCGCNQENNTTLAGMG